MQPDEFLDNGFKITIKNRMTRYMKVADKMRNIEDRIQWLNTSTLKEIKKQMEEERKEKERLIFLKATSTFVGNEEDEEEGFIREGTPV